MAMAKCKECQQEVASSAKACPHCGAADPALTMGGKLTGCGIFIVLVLGAAFGLGSCMFDGTSDAVSTPPTSQAESPTASQTPAAAVQEQKSLRMTPVAYANQLNAILEKLERPYRVDPAQITKGDVSDVLNAKLGKYASLVAGVSKTTGEILEVTVIAGGDGTPTSGVEIMMAASAALTAAAPGAPLKEVFTGLPEMIDGKTMTYGKVQLSAKRSEELGTWFFAEAL